MSSCAPDVMETQPQDDGYWVTVFGFPKRLKRKALNKMHQYGKIADHKVPARRNCNWFYVCYSCLHDAERAAKNQNARRLTSTVMIGVKLHGVRGSGHFSPDQADCKPTCSQLLPTNQRLCNIPIKQELQSDNEEDNPTHLNFCPGSPETKQHFKTEESEDLPFIISVESLSEVSVKQEQDGGLSQPKGFPTPSPQHFGHQVTGVEAVDNRLGKIEKENADKFTINPTNVKEEMESYDDSKCDRVFQPVNTCDGNMENDTSAIITSVQSEENVEGVVDVGGRSSKMEESDEDLKMTVEEGEVFCQKRGNWFSEVGEKEDADSSDHEICNDDAHDQNDASQAKVQGLQELCEYSSFGVMTVNDDKEEEDGGISERKTHELSSKYKKSDKQPSNLCANNLLGRKNSDSMRTSMEGSNGQHKKNQVRHQCQVCGYSTNKKSNLTNHMSKHSDQKPYVCEICNKTLKLKKILQGHIKRLHSGDKQFQCDNCGRRFCTASELKVHMVAHKSLHSGDKQFQCEVCGYSTYWKTHFTAHMHVHRQERPYVCDICNKTFKLKHHLQVHKTTHSGDKQFLCDNCGQRFSRKEDMKFHMIKHESLHSGDKQFLCDNSGRGFSRKAHLEGHMIMHKSLHSGEKQFQCEVCGQGFSRKQNMKRHLITHTCERHFKCKTCGMYFRQKSHLHRHEKTQHEKNPPIFSCNYCQYASKRKHATKAHEIHIHTKTYPYTCNVCKCGFICPYKLKRHMILKHKKQK